MIFAIEDVGSVPDGQGIQLHVSVGDVVVGLGPKRSLGLRLQALKCVEGADQHRRCPVDTSTRMRVKRVTDASP